MRVSLDSWTLKVSKFQNEFMFLSLLPKTNEFFFKDFCCQVIELLDTKLYYTQYYLISITTKKSLIAGNFLEIKGLVKLMVKAVALQIQGKPVEEIRETFQIEDPKWSPEELQKLKDENAWAYETKK